MSKPPKADNLDMPAPPGDGYRVGAVDFPWHFEQRGATTDETTSRSPQRHYPTMSLDHILKLPIPQVFAKDALLFLWTTGPLIATGAHVKIFEAYGFEPSATAFVWIKLRKKFDHTLLQRTPLTERDLHCATAYTTLQNAEFCILGRRGNGVPRQDRTIRQVLIENVREHSRKPEAFYERVNWYAEGFGPFVDIFGGRPRPGWDYWGHPHWSNNA